MAACRVLVALFALSCTAALAPAQALALSEPVLRDSPLLQWRAPQPDEQRPRFAEAHEISGVNEVSIRLKGSASLRQAGIAIAAEQIDFNQVDQQLEAQGDVRLFREGDRIRGAQLSLNLQTETGFMQSPHFVFGGSGGAGEAARLDFLGPDRYRFSDARYTSSETNQDWYVRADSVELDYAQGEGSGRNAVIVFKGVPILAAPLLSFPLGSERKSGFLPPTFGVTSKSGLEYLQPYYLNLAPNRDLTLNPRLMSRRGVQLGAEFRYLEPSYSGELRGEYLPSDAQAGRDRHFLTAQHRQRLGGGFGLSWNINHASDDAYLRDFSPSQPGVAINQTLERSAMLSWGDSNWGAFMRVLRYQTLQDPAALIVPPYERVPQLNLQGRRFDLNGFDLSLETDISAFGLGSWPMALGARRPTGSRFMVEPTVAWNLDAPWYFLRPQLSIHSAHYETRFAPGGPAVTAQRTIPLLSIDSGLRFEREASFLGNSAIQTLEPRFYYLNVPYRDQRNLPNYESVLADFNYAQLFTDNIYTGRDRIADANQLTAALTTRWIEPGDGRELARVSVGQRTYFNDVRVAADTGSTLITRGRSDILTSVYGAITRQWDAEATVQYNPQSSRLSRAAVSTRYRGGVARVLNLGYRLQRDDLGRISQESFETSGQWPLGQRWYGVGRMDYSLAERRPIEVLAGLEYDGGTWVLRTLAQRYAVARNNATTAFFIQLELNGFARLGSSPMESLRRGIRGYQLINPPPAPASVFERYE